MASPLKRDQIPPKQAEYWRRNFAEEQKTIFSLNVPQILLQKDTYKKLAGENENRLRIYLGLEPELEKGNYVLCAYAVSAFLLGSGDVYVDYETPVYKLGVKNENFSDRSKLVIESIRNYRKWRMGELDSENSTAAFRKFIFPNAYLLTKYELHEIFNVQGKLDAQIEFGVSKTMNILISPDVKENRAFDDEGEVFDYGGLCPPICDDGSIYNS
ncbi:MAG TPA: hypothetical protein P5210_02260 [Draconibacterium sp.]|nr:hypothetical protein [Draconibacterium sp.]HRX10440.1 hypothetical protein [Draconibacterium sp.]